MQSIAASLRLWTTVFSNQQITIDAVFEFTEKDLVVAFSGGRSDRPSSTLWTVLDLGRHVQASKLRGIRC